MDDFAILQSTPLFRGLSAETLVRLLDRLGAVRRSYIRGAVLVRAGQPSHSVGVILAGSIEAARLSSTIICRSGYSSFSCSAASLALLQEPERPELKQR